jgi:hypothetical protein
MFPGFLHCGVHYCRQHYTLKEGGRGRERGYLEGSCEGDEFQSVRSRYRHF